MTRTLLWDAGPGEVRAGLALDGKLIEFRLIRPRREMALCAAGEVFTARIISRLPPLVTLGGDFEALLQPVVNLPEGTLLAVEITRAPLPEPGKWKRAIVRPAADARAQSQPGPHASADPQAQFLRGLQVDEIICGDARVAADVRSAFANPPPLHLDAERIAEADFEQLIDAAVSGEFAIEGGMITIERTRAMTMVDVDGGGDPLALNLAAAREIPPLLRLLDIGGQVGIDFLALPDRKARLAVDAELATACTVLGTHERTAINGFGFAQIVRARRRPSVPEILCGITPGWLSLESRAIALLRDAARSRGHGKRQLVAKPAITELIRSWTMELGALRNALGAEIELVPETTATGYGYVHVAHH